MSARREPVLVTGPAFAALVAGLDVGLERALLRATSGTAVEAMLPGAAAFVLTRWVGPVLHARASGTGISLIVHRDDGSTLTFEAPAAPGVSELTEPHCLGFELCDATRVRFERPEELPDDATLVSQRPRAGALLELVDGVRIGIDRDLLVGRSPRVRRASQGSLPGVLALEHERVSRTHARISVRGGTVTLEDLGSANGTRVATAEGVERALVAGEPVALRAGMLVSVADRLAFRVVRVP